MINLKQTILLIFAGVLCVNLYAKGKFKNYMIEEVKGFPTIERGYEKGVSAAFAGVIGDVMYLAGGCNFPDKPVVEGGAKRYYSDIYAASIGKGQNLEWKKVGEMPEASAYGVTLVYKGSLIFVGGNNEKHSLSSVLRISPKGKSAVVIDTLPSLPYGIDNMSGAVVGDVLYIVGGNVDGKASRRVYSLNMNGVEEGWNIEVDLLGIARIQPIAVSFGKQYLGVWGGFSPKTEDEPAEIAVEGLGLNVNGIEWQNLPAPVDALGETIFTTGSTAINISDNSFVIVGGVNKEIFANAIQQLPGGYMLHEPEWYKFNDNVVLCEVKSGNDVSKSLNWTTIIKDRRTARAGASLVYHNGYVYIIGGELKPGIRLADIIRIRVK